MLVIVADRSGLAGAAITHALKSHKKPDTRVFWVSVWKDAEFYLKREKDVVIISAHLLKNFKCSSEFASEVKKTNPDAGFFVYNGMQDGTQQEFSLNVDGYIPSCKFGALVDTVIIPFFNTVIENRS